MVLAADDQDRKAATGRRLLARTAARLMGVHGMSDQEAWSAAEEAMNSPDPFQMPTFEELDDPSWTPGPVAWPPPGWGPPGPGGGAVGR